MPGFKHVLFTIIVCITSILPNTILGAAIYDVSEGDETNNWGTIIPLTVTNNPTTWQWIPYDDFNSGTISSVKWIRLSEDGGNLPAASNGGVYLTGADTNGWTNGPSESILEIKNNSVIGVQAEMSLESFSGTTDFAEFVIEAESKGGYFSKIGLYTDGSEAWLKAIIEDNDHYEIDSVSLGLIDFGEKTKLGIVVTGASVEFYKNNTLVWTYDGTFILDSLCIEAIAVDGTFQCFVDNVSIANTNIQPNTNIQKFTAKAGKSRGLDSIQFTGLVNATEADLNAADEIEVSLESEELQNIQEFPFTINGTTFKRGKYAGKDLNKNTLTLDTKTGKMAFSAKNLNLAGLGCPITVAITIGDYAAQMTLDEAIVNGTKPCPLMFIQGFANNLTADKYSFKPGKLAGQDSFTVSGFFTIAGDPNLEQDFAITVGSQIFTVDGSAFIQKKPNVYTCSNARDKASPALVTAVLDFYKCTYKLTVKNAALNQLGTLPFGLNIFNIFGFAHAERKVHFNTKIKHVFEIYMDTEYDYGGTDPGDEEFGFGVEIATDVTATGIEIKTPSDKTYVISDGYDNGPFEDGWYETGHEYDDDDDCYYWFWWIGFEYEDQLLDNYEDGLYEFTISFDNGTSMKTIAWFGVPDTNDIIPQPTQEPAFTSFDDNDFLTSPVSFQWESCQDSAASAIWLCLYDYDRDKETEWDFNKPSISSLKSPLRLKPGWYEAELDFETFYDSKNEDGIFIDVGKYSECDYYFEVDD